jgi:hypothetical protein
MRIDRSLRLSHRGFDRDVDGTVVASSRSPRVKRC